MVASASPRRLRAPFLVVLLLALALVPAHRGGAAASPAPPASDAKCDCKSGFGACQHWLGIENPTADPCYCDRCREVVPHTGKDVPDGMNPLCFASNRSACYLKRHAFAWHLTCSECLKETKCCPVAKSEFCPDCDRGKESPFAKDDMGRPAKETVLERLKIESEIADSDKLILMYNRHFYLATDIGGVKVKMRTGAKVFSAHEYAHLMLERAEMARKEFIQNWGERIALKKPIAIFLPRSEIDAAAIQTKHFGSPRSNQLYGGSDTGFMNGMCGNGFCASGQKYGPDDGLHFVMRHMIGHALISTWVIVDGQNRVLPRWLFEGVAHWLSRNQKRFEDDVTFCADEGQPINGSGKGWEADCAKMAAKSKLESIEKLFGKTAIGQLTLEDQQRSWSYVKLCLEEWREPFVAMVADLRRQKEVRDAFMQHLQCTPEIFDERWRERVLGKRRSMDPKAVEEGVLALNETPGARERKSIKAEQDLPSLAARVRALGTIDDAETVNVVMDLIGRNSELVRESVLVALLKMQQKPCLERVAAYGLVHTDPVVRAYAARVCGKKGVTSAIPKLREMVGGDRHWLARAEAAVACGMLKDLESIDVLKRTLTVDEAEKTRLAAMDALAMFGDASMSAIPLIAKHLESEQWQLRVVACQTLGAIGRMEAVDLLLERMSVETGHVNEEIEDALKKIARADHGPGYGEWSKWWERERSIHAGKLPPRPKPPAPPKVDTRYAQAPRYYGLQIYSNRVGFVLDMSLSMDTRFEPDPEATKQLSRTYAGATKLEICKEEITQALAGLNDRAHFSIIVFNTKVDSFNRSPQSASAANIDAAQGWLKAMPASGETNYYEGLRAALGLEESSEPSPNFKPTPDTLTFLTDGMPTQGEITDADTLLEWYSSLNRYARIRTHVIAFGTKGVDLPMLKKMADRNGGSFVHVAEKE